MSTKDVLRNLIVLQAAVWMGQWVATDVSIGPLVARYGLRFSYVVDPITLLFGGMVGTAVFVALLVAFLIASVGLLRFSAASRTAYLIVNIVAIVFGLLHGPLVRSSSMDFFHSANVLLAGVILAMVYSSPCREMYENRGSGQLPVTMTETPAFVPVPPSAPPPPAAPVFARVQPAVPVASDVPFCGACGESTQGAKFCPRCGKPVVMKRVCSRCGAEAKPGDTFCRQCGNPTP
jgi:hypothetical protein